jgi:hypothetical protein
MRIGDRIDFFQSRRGSVTAVAQEVAGALTEKGYKVVVQDYDIPFTANFVEAMHEAIKNARDLVILHKFFDFCSGQCRHQVEPGSSMARCQWPESAQEGH